MLKKQLAKREATFEAFRRERKASLAMSNNNVQYEFDTIVDEKMNALCVKQTATSSNQQVKQTV